MSLLGVCTASGDIVQVLQLEALESGENEYDIYMKKWMPKSPIVQHCDVHAWNMSLA